MSKDKDQELSEDDQKSYHQDVEAIRNSIRVNSALYDRSILTLSSSFLGISLIFIKDVVPDINKATCLCLLFISWFSFVSSIIITISSFLLSNIAGDRQIEIIQKFYREGGKEEKNYWNTATKSLNYISSIFFVVGILTISLFISLNLRGC